MPVSQHISKTILLVHVVHILWAVVLRYVMCFRFVSRLHRRGKSGVHSKRRNRGITGAKSDAYDCVVIYLYDTYEEHFL